MKYSEIRNVSDILIHHDWITSQWEVSAGVSREVFLAALPEGTAVKMSSDIRLVKAIGLLEAKAFFRGLQGRKHAVNPTGWSDKKPMAQWMATGGEGDACISALEDFWLTGLKEATARKHLKAVIEDLYVVFGLGQEAAEAAKPAPTLKESMTDWRAELIESCNAALAN
tara:strand:+ start:49 stop:555 length:507 start_codon:yes stop_codon:yes gene_type:complete